MTMQAATIEILIEKAGFEPRTAIAVAEAIDGAIGTHLDRAQLVTIPALDSRLADLRVELARHIYVAILGQMALLLGAAYFFVTHIAR